MADFVHYRANKTAWMTQKLFEEYVVGINNTKRLSSRNIVLVIDNASSHFLGSNIVETRQMQGILSARMSNILLVYLPANTTSVLQPLDQGVIAVVKWHYKQKLARWHLANIELALADHNVPNPDEVNVKQAIEWACSLGAMSQTTAFAIVGERQESCQTVCCKCKTYMYSCTAQNCDD